MGAIADSIWQAPVYLPHLQPPLTPAAVAAVEKQIGFKLPPVYLELLKKQNGGYIRYSLPDVIHHQIFGVGPYFRYLTGFDFEASQGDVNFPLNGLIPFDGDGLWSLCLDYRRNARVPAVTFVEISCAIDERVADCFPEYLAQLQLEVDADFFWRVGQALKNLDPNCPPCWASNLIRRNVGRQDILFIARHWARNRIQNGCGSVPIACREDLFGRKTSGMMN